MSESNTTVSGVPENQNEPSEKQGPNIWFKVMRVVFWSLLIAPVIAGIIFFVDTMSDMPPLEEIEKPTSALSSQVLASDGTVLDNFYSGENRVRVKLNEISPYVIDALIATEDARFYQHSGVDYMMLPAVIKRAITGTRSGASTVTMQLSRNLFDKVKMEQTVVRKIKELIASAILEKNFTKEEIIAAYLNTVNIYGDAYGIELAAQRLFSIPASELTIEQAATLVAMLRGQGVYDPVNKPEVTRERRNYVISNMVKYGFLNPDSVAVDSVLDLPLELNLRRLDHNSGIAAYFRQAVREKVSAWCKTRFKPNGEPYDLYEDGLRIYTTLDATLQRHAEAGMAEHLSILQEEFEEHLRGREPYRSEPAILTDLMRQSYRYISAKRRGLDEKAIRKEFSEPVSMSIFTWEGDIDTVLSPMDSIRYYSKILESGMVSIDPRNGEVKVWVGGIDFSHFKYDHVQQGKRQVGSTFKPFVYAAAIDNGRKPCDQELNQPIFFEKVLGFEGDTTRWAPKNSDGKVGGLMTLRAAMASSTNLVTARLMKALSPQVVVQYAHRFGIQSEVPAVPSLCLGVSDLNVLELTGAYCTFVNQGQWIEPHFISRIEDRYGNILAQFPPRTRQALNPQKAYLMVEMLKGVVDEPGGTGRRLRYRYQFTGELGAKTGTTQNHSDGWFVGVSPELVSGVWVGCSDRRMRFQSLELGQGANVALPIWALFMKRVYDDEDLPYSESATFSRPRNYYAILDCDSLLDARPELDAGQPMLNTVHPDDLDGF